MKKTIFTGAGVAIVTPMNADGSINFDKLGELIDFNIDNGTDAIIICGTTGESATMTDEEHIECIRYAVEKTNHENSCYRRHRLKPYRVCRKPF